MNAPLVNCKRAKRKPKMVPPLTMRHVLGLYLMWTQRYERKTKRKKYKTRTHFRCELGNENDLRLGNSSAGLKLKLNRFASQRGKINKIIKA